MSDLPGHDHDPNPAALDELRRAFSGGDDDRGTDRDDRGAGHRDPDGIADRAGGRVGGGPDDGPGGRAGEGPDDRTDTRGGDLDRPGGGGARSGDARTGGRAGDRRTLADPGDADGSEDRRPAGRAGDPRGGGDAEGAVDTEDGRHGDGACERRRSDLGGAAPDGPDGGVAVSSGRRGAGGEGPEIGRTRSRAGDGADRNGMRGDGADHLDPGRDVDRNLPQDGFGLADRDTGGDAGRDARAAVVGADDRDRTPGPDDGGAAERADEHADGRDDDHGDQPDGVETDLHGDADHDPSGAITEPTPVQRASLVHPASPPAERIVTLADLGSGSRVPEDPEPTPPSLADVGQPAPAEQPDADVEHDEYVERDLDDDLDGDLDGDLDRDGVDRDDTPELQAPERLVVVDPVPPAAPAARIIRIDDYSGSTEIAPADAAPAVHAGSPTAADAAPAADPDVDAGPAGLISISGDDLPDPVYVEGNLDRGGGGSIVFIENDETGDTLAPESERDMRRGIEPRMRERRVAVKRAQGRRRLKRALVVVGLIALVVGVLAVLGSSLFAVRAENVEVTGVGYAQGERFDEILDDAIGTPVLRLDTTRIEEDLEAIPWIDEAEVRADFPHGLVIDVRERAAVATYQGPDGMYRVLDREGRVLDVIENGYPYSYVLLGGPDAVDLEPGEFAPQGYAAASELARNLTSSLRGHVVRMEVLADGSRLVLELDDGSTVYFGEARDLLAKLVRLEAVLGNDQECAPGLIDVSTADTTRPEACSTSS